MALATKPAELPGKFKALNLTIGKSDEATTANNKKSFIEACSIYRKESRGYVYFKGRNRGIKVRGK